MALAVPDFKRSTTTTGPSSSAGGGCLDAVVVLVITEHSLVDPDLDTNDAVGGLALGKGVVHIRLQRRQRNRSEANVESTAHLSSTQTSGDLDANALGTVLHRGLTSLLQRSTKIRSLLHLLRDGFRNQSRVDLGVLDLDDLDDHLATGHRLKITREALDLAALLADHLTGSGGSDDDRQFLAGSLEEDVGHRRKGWGSVQSLIDELPDSIVLDEQYGADLWVPTLRAVA